MTDDAIRDKLIEALKTVYNERNFIIGVMSFARRSDDRKEILKFIEKGEDVTPENISLLALHLHQNHPA